MLNNDLAFYMLSYHHVFNGMARVAREEGLPKLFNGATWASSRAVMVTVGQLSSYDAIKQWLLASGYFLDSPSTHFLTSFIAVCKISVFRNERGPSIIAVLRVPSRRRSPNRWTCARRGR